MKTKLKSLPVIYTDAETNRSHTYAQVKSLASGFGNGIRATWGWQKGDVMGVFTPNNIDVPVITWGVLWAGGICSPANPAYSAEELAFQLKDSGAKALTTQESLLETAVEAADRVGIPRNRIILIDDGHDESVRFKHFTSIQAPSGASPDRTVQMDSNNDLAFLVYSSGTTGLPKGVMLTHRNIVANVLMGKAIEATNLTWNGRAKDEGDKILGFLPFFHIYGLTCLIHFTMFNGLTMVVMAKFDIEKFCAIVQDRKITFAYIVPPVVLLLGKHPVVDKYDLSSLRMLNSGAAPLTRELVDAVHARLKVPVKQGYGLSETSPTTHTQPWEDWYKTIGSVGKLFPNMTAKFMSPDGEELAAGETGELWVQGPNVFRGYHNNPEGTRACLTSDGFFQTGDVGHVDADGNFYITDRVKELIKYKGFQVPPAELEGQLLSHPAVNDVAVIGIYKEDLASEVPMAYVVTKSGVERSPKTAEQISQWLCTKVAHHKHLRGGIRFVDEIPKSASGKILRRVLKVKAAEDDKKGPRAKL